MEVSEIAHVPGAFHRNTAAGRRDAEDCGGRGTCGLFMAACREAGPGGLCGRCVKLMV